MDTEGGLSPADSVHTRQKGTGRTGKGFEQASSPRETLPHHTASNHDLKTPSQATPDAGNPSGVCHEANSAEPPQTAITLQTAFLPLLVCTPESPFQGRGGGGTMLRHRCSPRSLPVSRTWFWRSAGLTASLSGVQATLGNPRLYTETSCAQKEDHIHLQSCLTLSPQTSLKKNNQTTNQRRDQLLYDLSCSHPIISIKKN